MTDLQIDAIGMIAGICTSTSFIPQIVKIIKTGCTKDISLYMYVVLITGISLWVIYGILLGRFPIIFANSIGLILCLTVVIMKLTRERKNKA